ncbi:MAG: archease [Candidatus Aenigmatarchaeota archaeon]
MPFKFLSDIAIADVAFKATAKTIEELFIECARATEEAMVDTKAVRPTTTKKITLTSDALDKLLFDWLSELVYWKDAESLLFSKFTVKITKNKGYKLVGTASGEKIDYKKHKLRSDVKAITWHMFELKQTKDGWTARIIEDI